MSHIVSIFFLAFSSYFVIASPSHKIDGNIKNARGKRAILNGAFFQGDIAIKTQKNSRQDDWSAGVELNEDGSQVVTNIGEITFNSYFARCPVVQYTRNGGVYAVYVRISPVPPAFNAFSLFTDTWASDHNQINVDFKLYDSLEDVKGDVGAWAFCNYDDPDVGFPRDCGKAGQVGDKWFSMPGGRVGSGRGVRSGTGFHIFTGSMCPAPPGSGSSVKSAWLSSEKKLWPGGVILYQIDTLSIPNKDVHQNISLAIKQVMDCSCLVFNQIPSSQVGIGDFVQFRAHGDATHDGSGCWSYLGRTGGTQVINIPYPDCTSVEVILHEILHATGALHEHNRPDRDSYVKILYDNIQPDKRMNFVAHEWEYDNVTDGVQSLGTPYDLYSILHYPNNAHGINKSLPTMLSLTTKVSYFGSMGAMTVTDQIELNLNYDCPIDSHLLVDYIHETVERSAVNHDLLKIVDTHSDIIDKIAEKQEKYEQHEILSNYSLESLIRDVQSLKEGFEKCGTEGAAMKNEITQLKKQIAEQNKYISQSNKSSNQNIKKSDYYNYLDEMATSACVGMSVSHGKRGHITAIRRDCASKPPSCSQVCQNAAINNPGTGRQGRSWQCFESLHVYKEHPRLSENSMSYSDSGKVGPVVYRYNGCEGHFCGPNYCCCVTS